MLAWVTFESCTLRGAASLGGTRSPRPRAAPRGAMMLTRPRLGRCSAAHSAPELRVGVGGCAPFHLAFCGRPGTQERLQAGASPESRRTDGWLSGAPQPRTSGELASEARQRVGRGLLCLSPSGWAWPCPPAWPSDLGTGTRPSWYPPYPVPFTAPGRTGEAPAGSAVGMRGDVAELRRDAPNLIGQSGVTQANQRRGVGMLRGGPLKAPEKFAPWFGGPSPPRRQRGGKGKVKERRFPGVLRS